MRAAFHRNSGSCCMHCVVYVLYQIVYMYIDSYNVILSLDEPLHIVITKKGSNGLHCSYVVRV